MNYKYLFDCNDCTNKEVINGETYCIPLRAQRKPFIVGERTLECTEYNPGQIEMEGFDDQGKTS